MKFHRIAAFYAKLGFLGILGLAFWAFHSYFPKEAGW
jgi:hypothetical protein